MIFSCVFSTFTAPAITHNSSKIVSLVRSAFQLLRMRQKPIKVKTNLRQMFLSGNVSELVGPTPTGATDFRVPDIPLRELFNIYINI